MTAMHLHRQFRESHLENGVKVKYSFEIKPPLHNYNSYLYQYQYLFVISDNHNTLICGNLSDIIDHKKALLFGFILNKSSSKIKIPTFGC